MVADPSDRHARDVYADWLDERHDPRGAYLRALLAMEQLGVQDAKYWVQKQSRDAVGRKLDPSWLERVDPAHGPQLLLADGAPDRATFWRQLDRFVDRWDPRRTTLLTPHPAKHWDRLGLQFGYRIPDVIREWRSFPAVFSGHDSHVLHLELYGDGQFEGLLLARENQGHDYWGIAREHLDQPDPPVTVFGEHHREDAPHTSWFAGLRWILEFVWRSAPYRATNVTDGALPPGIDELGLTRIPWSPLGYGASDGVEVYEGLDALLVVRRSAQGRTALLHLRTRDPSPELPPAWRALFGR